MADNEQENDHSNSNESNDDDMNNINLHDYKGYFVEKEAKEDEGDKDDEDPIYYEYGAHFPYQFLYQQLEILAKKQARAENNANRHNRTTSNENQAEQNYSRNTKDNNHNNIFGFLNHNERSRNRNVNQIVFTNLNENNNENENEKEKGKSHNPTHHVKANLNNQIEIKPEENAIVYPKTKTEPRAILYSAFGSKLKINKRFNFSRKKIINEAKPVILKTVQQFMHTNNNFNNNSNNNKSKSKSKTLVNSNYQQGRSKRKELSVSSNTNTNNNNHNNSINNRKKITNNNTKTNTNIYISTNTNNNSIPKALNNMLSSYKNKPNAYFSPGMKPQNTKVVKKPQMKRTLTAQSQAKNKKALETSCQNKKQLTISLEKINKQKKKIDSPDNVLSKKEEKCKTHSTNNKPSSAVNHHHPKIINPIHSNIQDLMFSISTASNHISRNVNGKNDNICKSKTNNQNDNTNQYNREDNLTQNNINNYNHNATSQVKTMNIDISKQNHQACLQTVKYSNNNKSNSKAKAKIIPPVNKMKTYFEIKCGLNPKSKSNLINEIQKSMGISSLLAKNTKNSGKNENNLKQKNINVNIATKTKENTQKIHQTITKGVSSYPHCSSSLVNQKNTNQQQSKNSSHTNNKSHLVSNECIQTKTGMKHFNLFSNGINNNTNANNFNLKNKK